MANKPLQREDVWSDEEIEEEIKALEKWSLKEDSLTISSFACNRPHAYSNDILYNLADRYPRLRQTLSLARDRIASRRECGGLTGKLEPGLVGKTMAFYDRRFKEHLIEMKSQETANAVDLLTTGQIIDNIRKKKDKKALEE